MEAVGSHLALGGAGSPRGRGASSDRPPGDPKAAAGLPSRAALRPFAAGAPLPLKCVLVGDGGCGKTSLALTYCGQALPDGFVADGAPFVVVAKNAGVQGDLLTLSLWDTNAGEEMDRLRPLAYQSADLFLLCFSVVQPETYEACRAKWSREVAFHAPHAPTVLVGLMADLRTDDGTVRHLAERRLAPIAPEQGLHLATALECRAYVECSALTGIGVAEAVEKAAAAALPDLKAKLVAAAAEALKAEEAQAQVDRGATDRFQSHHRRDDNDRDADGHNGRSGDGRSGDSRRDGDGPLGEPGGSSSSGGGSGVAEGAGEEGACEGVVTADGSTALRAHVGGLRSVRKSAARMTGLRGLFSGKR